MPAETHQLGCGVDTESVLALLWTLLGDPTGDETAHVTLAELGVNADNLLDLWESACEEFGERTLGPEIDPSVLDPSMTLEAAAATMATLLGGDDDGG
jgi:hypothetical protein